MLLMLLDRVCGLRCDVAHSRWCVVEISIQCLTLPKEMNNFVYKNMRLFALMVREGILQHVIVVN